MNRTARRALLLALLAASLLGGAPGAARAFARRGAAFSSAPREAQEGESRRELVYKIINFAILAGALGFLLRKPLAEFFLQRSAAIRRSLDEGRRALEVSQAALRAVESKLARLEEEIRAFEASAAKEMQSERERLRQASAAEAGKILASARAEVEAATRAGLFELKTYAAEEALKLAEVLIRERLDEAGRRRLVDRFVQGLSDESSTAR